LFGFLPGPRGILAAGFDQQVAAGAVRRSISRRAASVRAASSATDTRRDATIAAAARWLLRAASIASTAWRACSRS
jgi:hypothetical protein